jgi:hypothetical protein
MMLQEGGMQTLGRFLLGNVLLAFVIAGAWGQGPSATQTNTGTVTQDNFMLAPKTEAKPTGDWSKGISDPTIHFVNWEGAKWVARLNGTSFELAPKTEAKPTGDWSKGISDPTIHFVNWEGAKWVARLNGTSFELAPKTEAKPTGDWLKGISDPTIHFVNWEGAKWVAKLQP